MKPSNLKPTLTLLTVLLLAPLVALLAAGPPDTMKASPAIFWVSDPVQPGEVVMVSGANFGDSPRVEISWLQDKEPGQPVVGAPSVQKSAVITPLQVTASSVKFLVPEDWKSGVYSFKVSPGGVSSAAVLVNAPDPWWQQGDWGKEASPGSWLRVFGKCLSLTGNATVALRGGGKTLILTPAKQDMWSLNVTLPANMLAGEYETWVHNGCGGPAGWKQVGAVTIKKHPPLWKSDVFDIRKFGATGNDEFDDGAAVQAALDAAGRSGGGIVFIPRGRFLINETLMIPRLVLLRGDGSDRSQLFWRDRVTPLETLIRGTNSFGIEDLSIFARNHLAGIMSDPSTVPDAGNVFLRRLHIRLNRFESVFGQLFFDRNMWGSVDRNRGAVSICGENVQVTDCDIFSSHSPFRFNGNYGLFSNNRCFQGGTSAFISGTQVIFENNVVEGSQLARGQGQYVRQNLYYANNRIGNMATGDAELFTTDAHGKYDVKFMSITAAKVTLDQFPVYSYSGPVAGGQSHDVNWKRLTGPSWTGNETRELALFIKHGTGAGQYRLVKAYNGREVEMDRPWDVPPDETSKIMLSPYFMHNLLINNDFNQGSTVQSWCLGIDWVIAGNKIIRGGGIHNVGIGVSWYHQYIGNEILVGSGSKGPFGDMPPRDSHLGVQGGDDARFTVFRRNILHNNARIVTTLNRWYSRPIIANDVVIEHNIIRDADIGIDVTGRNNGVLIWGNRFERIKEPIVGLSEGVFMHPAERLLNLLSAEGLVPEKLQGSSSWKTAWKRLESLQIKDPASAEVLDGVRICQAELMKAADSSLPNGQSLELIQALTGLTFIETSSAELQSLLVDSKGGTANTSLAAFLPAWSIPITLTLNLPPLPGWQATTASPVEVKPGGSATVGIKLTVPAGVWGKPAIPLACKVSGQGWQLDGSGTLQLASLSKKPTELVNQWMVVGPFASDKPAELPVINPGNNEVGWTDLPKYLQNVNINDEYPGLMGLVRWQQVKTTNGTIDFTKLFEPVENGTAYALAVLRVTRPTSVAITSGKSDMIYLNGERLGVSSDGQKNGNVKNSRTLKAGDHVLLCGVPQTRDRKRKVFNWRLSVKVEVDPRSTPGDVQVLPVEKFREVAAVAPK